MKKINNTFLWIITTFCLALFFILLNEFLTLGSSPKWDGFIVCFGLCDWNNYICLNRYYSSFMAISIVMVLIFMPELIKRNKWKSLWILPLIIPAFTIITIFIFGLLYLLAHN